jgi:hypothetical protein
VERSPLQAQASGSPLLSAKWKRAYPEMCGFVRAQLSIALARGLLASLCLRGTRDPQLPVFQRSHLGVGSRLGVSISP